MVYIFYIQSSLDLRIYFENIVLLQLLMVLYYNVCQLLNSTRVFSRGQTDICIRWRRPERRLAGDKSTVLPTVILNNSYGKLSCYCLSFSPPPHPCLKRRQLEKQASTSITYVTVGEVFQLLLMKSLTQGEIYSEKV